jgi:hypothetical protein
MRVTVEIRVRCTLEAEGGSRATLIVIREWVCPDCCSCGGMGEWCELLQFTLQVGLLMKCSCSNPEGRNHCRRRLSRHGRRDWHNPEIDGGGSVPLELRASKVSTP